MKIRILFIAALSAVILLSCDNLSIGDKKVNDEVDSVSYALGVAIGANLKSQFGEINPDVMAQAIEDIYNDEAAFSG